MTEIAYLKWLRSELLLTNQNLRHELSNKNLFSTMSDDPRYSFLKSWLERLEDNQRNISKRIEQLDLMEGMFK